MAGDVWQWTGTGIGPIILNGRKGGVARNPPGPDADAPFDPAEPTEKKRVQKGGSFLCSDQYCTCYMAGTRGKGGVSTTSNHVGFRCVRAPQN